MTKCSLHLTPRLPTVLLISVALLWSPFAQTAFALENPTEPRETTEEIIAEAGDGEVIANTQIEREEAAISPESGNGDDTESINDVDIKEVTHANGGDGQADTGIQEEGDGTDDTDDDSSDDDTQEPEHEEIVAPDAAGPAAETPLIEEDLTGLLLPDGEDGDSGEDTDRQQSGRVRRQPVRERSANQQTAPAGQLTVTLKADATNNTGSSQSDTITSTAAPTLTVTADASFGGANETVEVYYKNSSCAAGAAVPAAAFDASGTDPSGWTRYGASTAVTTPAASFDVSAGTTTLTAGTRCFFAAYTAAGTTTTLTSHSTGYEATIDTVAPTLTAFKIGSGNGATYKVTATDATAVTGRTKDEVTSGNCTAATDTTVSGWSDYTPEQDTGPAHDSDGRCVIITDAAGNKAAQHLLDSASINTIPATPTGLTATWAATSATLHWGDPSDSAITDYEYRHCDENGANCSAWTAVSGSATTISHEITGLSATTEYTLSIRALNANGSSVAASTTGTTGTIYDTDADGLIDIDTIQKLNAIRWDLNGDGTPASGQGTNYNTAFPTAATNLGCPKGICTGYELTADLDLDDNDAGDRTDDTYWNDGAGWAPIGADSTNNRFTATFNGNGFVIDNLLINRSALFPVALFTAAGSGAHITAVGIRDANVNGPRSAATLVAVNQSGSTVSASFSTGSITGGWGTGGLVGYNAGTVEASYSSATVTATSTAHTGGLVGSNNTTTAVIRSSYATGAVTTGTFYTGGLVGANTNSAMITDSYWNTDIISRAGFATTGAVGRTTAQLQSPVGYTGIYAAWDDRDIDNADGDSTSTTGTDSPWNFGSGSHYPALSFGGHREATQWTAAGNLSDLTVSVGTLAPVFDAYQYTYAAEVSAATASITVTPTVATSGASVTVDGATVSSGTASLPITLTAGVTRSVSIVVTPQSGIPHTYTIAVGRLKDYDDNDNGLIDIDTIQKLNAIRWDLNGDGIPAVGQAANYAAAFSNPFPGMGCKLTDHDNDGNTADVPICTGYELTADLDLDDETADDRTDDTYWNGGSGWVPIGTDSTNNRFTGIFNGNGFVIDNLLINRSGTYTQALFAATATGATITAVGLRDVNITGSNGTAALVGASKSGTVISASFSTGTISGGWGTGGLVGYNEGTVEASYSSATVSGTTAVGGLVGYSTGSGASIKNSYARGAVTQSGATHLGGLVGHNYTGATITNSYWDTTITSSTGTDTTGATGKTTAQLQSPATYTGIYATWDDRDIDNADGDSTPTTGTDSPWNFGSGDYYPALTFGGHREATQWPAAGNLSDLTVSVGTLTPVFDAYQYTYIMEVSTTTASLTVTPTVQTVGAGVTVDGTTVSSGSPSAAITLTAGATRFVSIVVTPASGTPHTYTIAVSRLKDYDDNDNGLIDVDTIQKLNAIRWDLNGDGVPASGQAANYTATFSNSLPGMGCKLTDHDDNPSTDTVPTCTGYELTQDLDFDDNDPGDRTDDTYYNSGAGWNPIGRDTIGNRFISTFNGNGFVIDNLFISRTDAVPTALFASASSGAHITAVGIRDTDITGAHAAATLVAANQAGSIVSASFSTGTVSGGWGTGGLVGYNAGTVEASYSTATVTGVTHAIGGLVGASNGSTASIKNSYARGTVIGGSDLSQTGGLVGYNRNGATTPNSYWDSDIVSAGGEGVSRGSAVGKTTVELQSPTAYTSTAGNGATAIYTLWDDSDIDNADNDNTLTTGTDSPWNFGGSTHYPVLSFGGHRLSTQWPAAGNLNDLTTSVGTPAPVFDAYQYTYTVEVPIATTSLTVTPTVATSGATVTVDGTTVTSGSPSAAITLTAGDETDITIVVTSQSGTLHTYTIAVIHQKDYDDDDDGLIDIRTHQQLNAVRWDLDGNSTPTSGQEGSYQNAFPHPAPGMGCKLTDHDNDGNTPQQETCTGYELRADIDLDTDGDNDGTYTGDEATPTADTGDAYYNSGSGWEPIGTPTASFSATFNGNGHTISNLFINRASTDNVGLFGHIGTPSNNYTRIEAVGISNALVIGDGKTGILVGESEKPVTASWTTGAVRGGTQVGGLIGLSESDVTASYSLATVTATNKGGGLIGEQDGGSITATYAGGGVVVTGADKGGLVATATNTPTDTDNYYNSDITGLVVSALGTAKTDTELRTPTGYTDIYADWNVDIDNADTDDDLTTDTDDPWHITAGNYPVLDYGVGADIAEQATSPPVSVILTTDTGTVGDNITNNLTGITVTVPVAQRADIGSSSTVTVHRYDAETDGSCAAPIGTNTGWTQYGTRTGTAHYTAGTGVWAVAGSNPVAGGSYCFTARYDTDGTGATPPSVRSVAMRITYTTAFVASVSFLNDVSSVAVASDTISVSVTNGFIIGHGFSADTACVSGEITQSVTGSPRVHTQRITSNANNAQFICYQVEDDNGNISYTRSAHRLHIDTALSALTDTTLSVLSITPASLTPSFTSATRSYTASVPHSTATLTVTPTPTNSEALITALTADTDGSVENGEVDLTVGANIITVSVTAQDGTTTGNYTITVTRASATLAADLHTDSDTGTSDTDNETNDTTPTLTITPSGEGTFGGSTGDTARIFYKTGVCSGHTVPATALTVATPENDWIQYGTGVDVSEATASADITGTALTPDTYCFFAALSNGAQTDPSTHSTALEVIIDTTPPAAAPTAIVLHTPSSSPSDDDTPTVTVTANDGDIVQLYDNSNSCTASARTGTTGTVPTDNSDGATGTVEVTTGILSAGAHTLYAASADTAGNIACFTTGVDYTVTAVSATLASGTSLTEETLNNANVTVTLPSGTVTASPVTSDFTVNGISGVSVTAATASGAVATLTLSVDTAMYDIDTDTDITVTMKPAAHSGLGHITTGTLTVTATDESLTAPADVVVSPRDTSVVLSWDEAPFNENVTRYEYQERIGAGSYGNWTAVTGETVSDGTVSFTRAGLTTGTAYAYKIRSFSDAAGPESTEVTATPSSLSYGITAPAANSTVNETTGGTLTVTVGRPFPSSETGDVLCTLNPNTTGGITGTAPADFYDTVASAAFSVAPTALASFRSGDTTADCVFTINNDTDYEPNEHFTVTLSSPVTGAVPGAVYRPADTARNFSIPANDITIGFEDATIAVYEGSGTAEFCAVVTTPVEGTSIPSDVSIAVTASTADGTAGAGSDYTALSAAAVGTLTDSTRRVCGTVSITDDVTAETAEDFTVALSASAAPAGQVTLPPAATITINKSDNDGDAPLVLDLTTDTGSNTADDITNDDTPEFTVTSVESYGANANSQVRLYRKTGACGALPTASTITDLTTASWTLYNATDITDGLTTSTAGITGTALADGDYCFLSLYTANSAAVKTDSYSQLEVTIDDTAPAVHIAERAAGKVFVWANETVTVRTKDNTADGAGSCDTTVSTTTGWSDYDPTSGTETDYDLINGRCFIAADTAGNKIAVHSDDRIAGVTNFGVAGAGVSGGVHYRNDTTPDFTGSAESTATVTVYTAATGGTAIASGTSTGGAFTVTVPQGSAFTANDTETIFSSVTPSGGAESPRFSELTLTISAPPVLPVPSAVAPATDSGTVGDNITNDVTGITVTIPPSGRGDINSASTVTVYRYDAEANGSCVAPAPANTGWTQYGTRTGTTHYTAGVWAVAGSNPAIDGAYCFTARYDTDGSEPRPPSGYHTGVAITYDTTPPTLSFINDVSATPTGSDTIFVSSSEAGITGYGYSTDNACIDGEITETINGSPLTHLQRITTTANNGKYLCYKAVDGAGHSVISVSAQPLNVNTTLPLSTDTALSALSLTPSGILTPVFSSGTHAYTATVANTVTAVTVNATPNHPEGLVTAISGADNLSVGDNTVTITVTAQDTVTTQDYTVTVHRYGTDTAPNAFSFATQTNVASSVSVIAASIIPTGFNGPAQFSVINGTLVVNGIDVGAGGGLTDTVNPGDSIALKVTSAATVSTDATATLTLGGVSAGFTVTTGDGSPAASAAPSAALTESNLDGAVVDINLANTQYIASPTLSHFTLTLTDVSNLTVTSIDRIDSDTVRLTLDYAGTDLDAAVSFTVTVAAAAHTNAGNLTTGSVTITATDEPLTVLTNVTAAGRHQSVILSWDEPAANENVTGYEYREAAIVTANPAVWRSGSSVRNLDVRTQSFTPTATQQSVAVTLIDYRGGWVHSSLYHAYGCSWTAAAGTNPVSSSNCTRLSENSGFGYVTYTITPTQAMFNNGGVVIFLYGGTGNYAEWVPFIPPTVYGNWTAVSGETTTDSTVSFTRTGLTNGAMYKYKIRSVKSGVDGPASAEVTTTPYAPTYRITAPAANSTVAETDSNTLTVQVTGSYAPTVAGDVLCTLTGDSRNNRDPTEHADFYNTAASATFTTAPTALASFTADGSTTDTVSSCIFTLDNDTDFEPDEHFTVALSSPGTNAITNAVYGNARLFSIPINDITLSVESTAVSAVEGGTAEVCAEITAPSAGTPLPAGISIAVIASTADGTATAGSDYTALSSAAVGTLNDVTRRACTTVSITDDATQESTENFTVSLGVDSPVAGQTIITPATATVTIAGNDAGGTATIIPDLSSDTGSDTTDNLTNDDTPEFSVSSAESYGGITGSEVRLYYKTGACGTAPTVSTITALTALPAGWTLYKTTATPTSVSSTTGITSTTQLSDGDNCILALHTADGFTISTASYGQLTITVDTIAPVSAIVERGNRVFLLVNETAIRTKDSTTDGAGSCDTAVDTTGAGWSDYIIGTGLTHTGDGRCFVITDLAGNKMAAHSDDTVVSVTDLAVTDATLVSDIRYRSDTTPAFTGSAENTATVKIYAGDSAFTGTVPNPTHNRGSNTDTNDASAALEAQSDTAQPFSLTTTGDGVAFVCPYNSTHGLTFVAVAQTLTDRDCEILTTYPSTITRTTETHYLTLTPAMVTANAVVVRFVETAGTAADSWSRFFPLHTLTEIAFATSTGTFTATVQAGDALTANETYPLFSSVTPSGGTESPKFPEFSLTVSTASAPAAPAALSFIDTGDDTADSVTNNLITLTTIVPQAERVNIGSSSSLSAYRYTPESGGSCAAPTGSNTGWAQHGPSTGISAYNAVTGVWTITATNPPDGTYCLTANYDTDGATDRPAGAYSTPFAVTLDDTAPVLTFVNAVSGTSTASDTIFVTADDAGITGHGFSDDSSCDGDDSYTAVNGSPRTHLQRINTTANNGKYVCYRTEDTIGNIAYFNSTNALTINTALTPSTDAELSALTISPATLAPALVSGTHTYTATVTNATTTLTVAATPSNTEALVTAITSAQDTTVVNGVVDLAEEENVITVTVTAQDGTTTQDYTITVYRYGTDTTPDSFSFMSQTDVATSASISSASIVPTGFNAPASFSVTDGTLVVNGTDVGAGGSPGDTVNPGDSIALKVTSSASHSTGATATLTLGTVSGGFTVTTSDGSPAASALPPMTLTEANLDGAFVDINLANTQYIATPLANHFTPTPTGITGLTVQSVSREDSDTVRLTLDWTGNDLDAAASFTVAVAAAAHTNTGILTTGSVSIGATNEPLTAPANAEAVGRDVSVILTWDESPANENVTGYEYQERIGSGTYGNWTAVTGHTVTDNSVSFTRTGLLNNTAYSYKIRSVKGATGGPESAELTATPYRLTYRITSPAAESILNETDSATLTITVTGNGPAGTAGDVLCTIAPDTAGGQDGTENADFLDSTDTAFSTNPTALASFTANNSSTDTVSSCVFTLNNDTDYEPDEHFTVTLSSPVGGAVPDAAYHNTESSRDFSVAVSDITIGLESTTIAAEEGDTPQICAAVTAPVGGTPLPSGVSIAVTASTADGTATAGSDYTALSSESVGTLNDGTRRACTTVSITDDTTQEPAETLTVTLAVTTPAGQVTLSPDTATVTIGRSDDGDNAFTVDLTTDTGADTTDNLTNDDTPEFTLTNTDNYGGSSENEVRLYHKTGACGTLPTATTITGPTGLPADWTHYATTDVSGSSVTSTAGISSGTSLADDGDYCFLAFYSRDGTNIVTASYGQLDISLDTTAPVATVIETVTGTVYAYTDGTEAVTLTKDAVASSSCIAGAFAEGDSGVTVYTPFSKLTADNTDGRCFLLTDTAGNVTAAHTSTATPGISALSVDGTTLRNGRHHTRTTAPTIRGTAAANAPVRIYRPSDTRLPFAGTDPVTQKLPAVASTTDVRHYYRARAHLVARTDISQTVSSFNARGIQGYLCPSPVTSPLAFRDTTALSADTDCVSLGTLNDAALGTLGRNDREVTLTSAMVSAGAVVMHGVRSNDVEADSYRQWLPVYQNQPVQIASVTAAGDGNFTASPATLSEGDITLSSAFSTDGGTSYTEPINEIVLSVDTSLSPALTLSRILSGTGHLAQPRMSVFFEQHATLQFYSDSSCGTTVGTPLSAENTETLGHSDITYPVSLTDGSHTLHARQTDAAGNVGGCTALASVSTDTQGPQFSPLLDDSTNGGSNDDLLTNYSELVINTGAVTEAGSIQSTGWWVTGATTLHSSAVPQSFTVTDKATGGSFTTDILSHGENTIHIHMTDAHGNARTESITVTVDRELSPSFTDNVAAGPVREDTATVWVLGGYVTGHARTATNTCDNTVTFTEPDTQDQGLVLRLAAADNTNYICVRAEDEAGGVSYLVSANAINIDTTQPALTNVNLSGLTISEGTLNPSLTATVADYTFTRGTIASITLTPTAETAGATITVNGTTVASGTPSGTVTIDPENDTRIIIVVSHGTDSRTYTITALGFTLDITGDGTVGTYDAIAHYIYEVFKAQAPNGRQAMTPFLTGGDDAATVWSRLQASAATRDFSGNGDTDQQDAIIHYIYEVFKDQEPNGRQAMTPFLTGAGANTGAAVFTLLNGYAGR